MGKGVLQRFRRARNQRCESLYSRTFDDHTLNPARATIDISLLLVFVPLW